MKIKKIGTLGIQGKSLETLPAITLNFFVRVQTRLCIGFQSQYANLSTDMLTDALVGSDSLPYPLLLLLFARLKLIVKIF